MTAENTFPDNLADVSSIDGRGMEVLKPILKTAGMRTKEMVGSALDFAHQVQEEAGVIYRFNRDNIGPNASRVQETVATSARKVADRWSQFVGDIESNSPMPDWKDTNDLASIEPRGAEALQQSLHDDVLPHLVNALDIWIDGDPNIANGVEMFETRPEDTPFVPYTIAHSRSVLNRYQEGKSVDPQEWVSVGLLPVAATANGWRKLPKSVRTAIEMAPLGAAVACGAQLEIQTPTPSNLPVQIESGDSKISASMVAESLRLDRSFKSAGIHGLDYGTLDGNPTIDQQVEDVIEAEFGAMGGERVPGSENGRIFNVTLRGDQGDAEFYLVFVPTEDGSQSSGSQYEIKIATVTDGYVSIYDLDLDTREDGSLTFHNPDLDVGIEVGPDSTVHINVGDQAIDVTGGSDSGEGTPFGALSVGEGPDGAQFLDVNFGGTSSISQENPQNTANNGTAESGAMPTFTPESGTPESTATGAGSDNEVTSTPLPPEPSVTPLPPPTAIQTESPTATQTPEVAAYEPLNLGDNPELFLDIAENAAETGTVVEFVGPVTGRIIRIIVHNPQEKPDWTNMEARVAAMEGKLDQPFNPNTHGDATFAEVIDTYYDLVLKQADPDGDGTADAVLIRTGNGSNGTVSRSSEMHTPLSEVTAINIVLGDGNNSESGADGADFMGTGHRTSRPSSEPNTKFATHFQDGQMFFAFLPEATPSGTKSLEQFTFPTRDLSDGEAGAYVFFPSWEMATFGNTDKTQAALFNRPATANLAWRYLTGKDLNTVSDDPENTNANLVNMFAYQNEILRVVE